MIEKEYYKAFAEGFEKGYLKALEDVESKKSSGVEIFKAGYKQAKEHCSKTQNGNK